MLINMLYKILTLLIFSLFLEGCAGSSALPEKHSIALNKLSLERFGTGYRHLYNSDTTFSIAVKQEKASARNPNPLLQYFVFNLADEKIIYEDNVPGGSIFWKDNGRIEVRETPGTVRAGDGNKIYGYIYDVKSGIKSELDSAPKNN